MSQILKQIRWQQRYLNLKKSFVHLSSAVSQNNLNNIELAGLIQFFEITFELAWKTMKDYLEAEGINASSPRDVIKQAFAFNVIKQGEIWLDALDKRNLMTHTYQEEIASYAVNLIKSKYTQLFSDLVNFLETKIFSTENYGFSLSEFLSMIHLFTLYPEVESVKIFGSRALGNYKPQSDIDLCLMGNINLELLSKIKTHFSEKMKLPYSFDVVVYHQITDEAFQTHINSFGKIIYER